MKIKNLLYLIGFSLLTQQVNAQYKDDADRFFEISKNMEIYNQIIKELNADYIKTIDPNRMLKVGVEAMLTDLDPYTVFYSQFDIEDFQLESQGNLESLGISIINRNGEVIISNIKEGSPILEQNISIGSSILKVNQQSLEGKTEEEINTLLASSSTIELSIKDLNGKHSNVKLQRKAQAFKTLRGAELLGKNKDIAYVSLGQFMHSSEAEIKRALQEMKAKTDLKGVILDLRGNPGGLLNQAISISNLFLPKNTLVVTTDGNGAQAKSSLSTKNNAWDEDIPVVVLVNHQSASASEIVSGTMQDLDRGVVVGARSYGKGLVQHIRPLGYNTRLKITTAYYYTPSGRCIQSIDYAHKNEDGSVGYIPEEKRQSFKTKKGRIVKDGGGVEPDIAIEEEQANPLLIALESNYLIFDFASDYFKKHPNIGEAEKFFITEKDWQAFKQFVANHEKGASITLGKDWEEWKKRMEEEQKHERVKSAVRDFENNMRTIQMSILEEQKNSIQYALSQEIVRRYALDEGVEKFKFNQANASLQKAIEILENPSLYKKALAK